MGIIYSPISNGEIKKQEEEKDTFGFWDAVKKTGSDIASSFKSRGENIANEWLIKKQNPASTGLKVVGQGAGFIGDAVGSATTNLMQAAAENAPESVQKAGESAFNTGGFQSILAAGGKVKEGYDKIRQISPELADHLDAVLNIASMLPVEKAASTAVKGTGKAVGSAVEGAGKAVEMSGKAVSKGGEAIYKTAIDLNKKEAGAMQAYKAGLFDKDGFRGVKPKTTADTALEQGLIGSEASIGVQAAKAKKSLWDTKIGPAIKNVKERVSVDELFNDVAKKIADTKELAFRQSLEEALESLKEVYSGVKDFSLEELQDLKSELAKRVPSKVWRGQEISGALNNVRAEMAKTIREKILSKLPDGMKEDYFDYGNLINLTEMGQAAMTKGRFKGGFGGFMSALYDAAVTPVKTIGGKVLYEVGGGIQFVGDKGIKTFGQYLNGKLKIKNPALPVVDEAIEGLNKAGKAAYEKAKNTQPGLTIKDVSKDIPTTKANKSAIIDDMDNALIQEAKKYKSAEEFVKAQGASVYHGTSADFDVKDFKGGYLTGDKKYADVYQSPSASSISYGSEGVKNKMSGKGRTIEFVLPENAKIFDYTNPQHKKLLDDYWGKSSMSYEYNPTKTGQLDWTEGENLVEYFDEKGIKFDGIKLDEAGGIDPASGLEVKRAPSIRIINPKVLKTKSQLEEIWKKANSSTPDPLIQEAKKYKSAEEFVKFAREEKALDGFDDSIKKLLKFRQEINNEMDVASQKLTDFSSDKRNSLGLVDNATMNTEEFKKLKLDFEQKKAVVARFMQFNKQNKELQKAMAQYSRNKMKISRQELEEIWKKANSSSEN